MHPIAISLAALATVLVLLFGLWLVSLRLRDASIVDVFWGPGFAILGGVAFALAENDAPRAWLVLACTAAWGLRLGGYLLWRNAGTGEDARYRAMRERDPEGFPRRSLFVVFGLQGLLMWIVSLPVQATVISPGASGLGALDGLALALFAFGLAFETVGDAQLARFKSDPANAGRVLDRGLWAWTRHPNYFGDATVWWGLGAFALAAGHPWTLLGPAVMTFLLMRVSGVPLLERSLERRRSGYDRYRERTSAFVPWPPRSR